MRGDELSARHRQSCAESGYSGERDSTSGFVKGYQMPARHRTVRHVPRAGV